MGKKKPYVKRKSKTSSVVAKKITPKVKLAPYPTFGKKEWTNSSVFILLAAIMYGVAVTYGYVLDDTIVITNNSFTKNGLAGVWDIFSTESFAGYFGEQKDLVQGARYRPLSIVTFAIEHQFFGGNPAVSHGVNIILYGLTGIALYRVLQMLYINKGAHRFWNVAFIATLLYLVHPVHTEAVANIKGRDEIMTMLFSILSIIMVLKWDQTKSKKYAIFSALIFFFAILAKENAVTFLAIIPITLIVFRKKTIGQAIKLTLPIFITFLVYLAIRYSVIGYLMSSESEVKDLMNNPFLGMSSSDKYATISFTLWKYIQLSVFPHPLAHDYYPYAIPRLTWSDYRAFLPLMMYVAIAAVALFALIKKKENWYGFIFYLTTISIVSNVLINVGTFMNERFIFMASAGICMLMAIFFVKFISTRNFPYSRHIAIGLISLIVVGYIAKTMVRVPDWKDALSLNQSAVIVNPGSARANSFMATAIYNKWRNLPYSEEKKSELIRGAAYAQKSIDMYPNYRNANLMKVGISAELYKINNNLDQLLIDFGDVMMRRPDIDYIKQYLVYLEGRLSPQELSDFYYNTAYVGLFQQRRNSAWALEFLQMAYNNNPTNRKIIQALAEIYQAKGDTVNADKYFKLIE